jgi:hypothetical protein
MSKIQQLFKEELAVVNIGAQTFAEDVNKQNKQVINLAWKPPAGGKQELISALEKLDTSAVEEANAKAVDIIKSARPVLVDVEPAINVIPGMTKHTILHAGPPITWDKMAKVMKGGVIGALIFEGLAKDAEEAIELASSGQIKFSPCHEHSTVGPMAGIVSASMQVQVIENKTHGNFAYCGLNEGMGKVLRYGVYSQEVIDRLKWMAEELGPALKAAVKLAGGIDMRSIIAQALHMGDECHNRNKAGSILFLREITRQLVRVDLPKDVLIRVIDFLSVQDHWTLYLTMPACKAAFDAAHGIENCTIVTAMARNGVELGLRVSGCPGNTWFSGPAQMINGLLFPGFTMADANPDMGDSSITETSGLGAFAMGGAPAVVQFVGGSVDDAIGYSQTMREITLDENQNWTMPNLNFRGTSTGIDVRKVVQTGIVPFITTGIAHKEPGVGQIGAGVTRAPMECFEKALLALSERVKG